MYLQVFGPPVSSKGSQVINCVPQRLAGNRSPFKLQVHLQFGSRFLVGLLALLFASCSFLLLVLVHARVVSEMRGWGSVSRNARTASISAGEFRRNLAMINTDQRIEFINHDPSVESGVRVLVFTIQARCADRAISLSGISTAPSGSSAEKTSWSIST